MYICIYVCLCVCVCVYICIYIRKYRGWEAPGLLCAGGGLSLTTECVLWLSLGVGKPLDYYVLEEDCHYSITWPSKYGCPAASGTV